MNVVMAFIYEALRKFFFGASMVWLIALLGQAGASEDEIKRWVEITCAAIIIVLTTAWSRFVKPWLSEKFPSIGRLIDKDA